jgi:hypothetical protein
MTDLTIPKNLVEQLCKGNCVLFVGAGISMGQGGLPGGGQLAQELAQRCDYPSDDLALPRVAQYYAETMAKADLLRYVCQRIREARPEPMETHRLIAALPFKIIVSTNYDCLIERALEAAGRPFNVIVTDKQVSSWDEGGVNLLKIHGCVTQWESIVLTKDDYWEFFEQRPNMANILSAEAARRSLLFVGHGLGDDDFKRIYLQVTRNLAEFRPKSYAVQLHPNPVDVTLWKAKRLEIIPADAAQFLRALSEAVAVAMPVEEEKEEIPRPERPYKFLDYFEATDRAIFYGRQWEAMALQRQIMAHKLTVLYGASGVGKTSLIQAGVIPRLHEDGYTTFYVRSLEDPAQAIKTEALRLTHGEAQLDEEARATALPPFLHQVLPPQTRLVVFLDQFEEFFIRLGDAVRRAFIEDLAACLEDDTLEMRAVLSLRDDYFVRLDEFSARWPKVFDNRFRLRNLDEDKARLAIFLPARQFGLSYGDALLRQLLADLESGGVEPAQLQIVCHRLYEDLVASGQWSPEGGQPGTFTLAQYQRLGGTRAILAGYLDDVLAKLPEEEQELARGVLKSMVTGQETKAALSAREIAQDEIVRRLGLDERTVGRILDELRDSRVVRKLTLAEGESYELAHEVMVDKVWQWVTEEEARFKYARDMLRQDLNNYCNLGILMPQERLEIVNLYRGEMSLSGEEMELLFRSALVAGYEVPYWFERAREAGVPVEGLAQEGLESPNFRTRAAAVAALGFVASAQPNGRLGERFVEPITGMLDDDYPQVRVAAIHALEKLRPDGAWRKHLKYECYVPAGEFVMGEGSKAHEVYLDAFYIGKYPVTNAEYKRYMDDIGRAFEIPAGKADHPVVEIFWYDVRDYAAWAGMHLLTETEWEKAASWDEGRRTKGEKPVGRKRKYPWGDGFDKNKCNTRESRIGDTTPVGRYSPRGDSPYGCADMAGNVWEWTSSLKKEYPYRANDGREDMSSYDSRVLRGGSFYKFEDFARCASRLGGYPDYRDWDIGVRVGVVAAP